MEIFKRKPKKTQEIRNIQMQTRPLKTHPFSELERYQPLVVPEARLYKAIREAIPMIDSALYKIQRLIGGFRIACQNKRVEKELNDFILHVPVGNSSTGLEYFICSFLDSMLLYGNAVGEIVLDETQREIAGLYIAAPEDIILLEGDTPFSSKICCKSETGLPIPITNPSLVIFSALNPKPGSIKGDSILKSVPYVSSILMKIYQAIDLNFERIGNIRFAVTYKPSDNNMDQAYAKERACAIAKEWSEGMTASKYGDIRDFVTVGDVSIKVIGAENQMIDCEVPARQMLEQIISKLCIPPFMLGISWSSTERMSKNQADMLCSELSYFRRQLTPIIQKICTAFLRLKGYTENIDIEWDVLNFDDEISAAKSRLYNAQAEKIEREWTNHPKPLLVDISSENAQNLQV